MKDYHVEFGARDFKEMTFNVMKSDVPPSKNPFFKGREEFQRRIKDVDMDCLIKYICLFYDPKSPLVHRISDHIERKKAAAVLAGFTVTADKQFLQPINEVLYCKNKYANACILEFLRSTNSPDWQYICATSEAYQKILTELMTDEEIQEDEVYKDDDGKTKIRRAPRSTKSSVDLAVSRAKLAEYAESMADSLKKRMYAFLQQDESPYLHENLFTLVEETRKKAAITPERQAGIEA